MPLPAPSLTSPHSGAHWGLGVGKSNSAVPLTRNEFNLRARAPSVVNLPPAASRWTCKTIKAQIPGTLLARMLPGHHPRREQQGQGRGGS